VLFTDESSFHINSLFLESIDISQPSGSFNICGIEHVSKGKHNCNKAPLGFVIYGQYVRRWAGAVCPSSVEAEGAGCFNAAVKAARMVTLPDITSSKTGGNMNIISELVTDQQALQVVETFLDEERVLVELACGAALAAVYCGVIQSLQGEGRLPVPLAGPLVMIVCGGSSVNQAQLEHLRKVLNR
uniref:Tryptophan synthase beta chain-like PALP domain-containing protein n=1 Tax=Oncorhynchus mykiss TaxID=8022 RepID=A0A8K9WTI2_ONCMY